MSKKSQLEKYIAVLRNVPVEATTLAAKNRAIALLLDDKLWNGSDKDARDFKDYVKTFTMAQLRAMVGTFHPQPKIKAHNMKAHVEFLVEHMKKLPTGREPVSTRTGASARNGHPQRTFSFDSLKDDIIKILADDYKKDPYGIGNSKENAFGVLCGLLDIHYPDYATMIDDKAFRRDWSWIEEYSDGKYIGGDDWDDDIVFFIGRQFQPGHYPGSYFYGIEESANEWSIFTGEHRYVFTDKKVWLDASKETGHLIVAVKLGEQDDVEEQFDGQRYVTNRQMAYEAFFDELRDCDHFGQNGDFIDMALENCLKRDHDDHAHLTNDFKLGRDVAASPADQTINGVSSEVYYSTPDYKSLPSGRSFSLRAAVLCDRDSGHYLNVRKEEDDDGQIVWSVYDGNERIEVHNTPLFIYIGEYAKLEVVLSLFKRVTDGPEVDHYAFDDDSDWGEDGDDGEVW